MMLDSYFFQLFLNCCISYYCLGLHSDNVFPSDVVGNIGLLKVDCHGGVSDVDRFRVACIFDDNFIGHYAQFFRHGELFLSLLFVLVTANMMYFYVR